MARYGRAPRVVAMVLAEQPADTQPNMSARFQIQAVADLEDRLDNSQWRLRIEDVATGAVGQLERWSLSL
jgi:hypothetical protein